MVTHTASILGVMQVAMALCCLLFATCTSDKGAKKLVLFTCLCSFAGTIAVQFHKPARAACHSHSASLRGACHATRGGRPSDADSRRDKPETAEALPLPAPPAETLCYVSLQAGTGAEGSPAAGPWLSGSKSRV